ncbi:armadillo-type protein [Mycena olivaceomarginata]|nr:armadillo-type protein [Mycena olivaceomarginata]
MLNPNEEGLRPGDILQRFPHLWPPRPCCLWYSYTHPHDDDMDHENASHSSTGDLAPSHFYLPPHILTSPEPTAEASLEHHFGGVANEPHETRKVPRPRRRQCMAHHQRRSQLSEIPQRMSRPECRQRGDQHARSHPKRQRWVSSAHTEAVDQPAPHCPPLRTHPSALLGPPSRPPFVRPCPATPLSFSNPTRTAASRCILHHTKPPVSPVPSSPSSEFYHAPGYSQLKFSLFPMLNLVHRPFHGTDPAKYGMLQRKFDLKDTLKPDTDKEMEPVHILDMFLFYAPGNPFLESEERDAQEKRVFESCIPALDIIRKNHGSPLTTAILETYASYFPWDYVSHVQLSIHLFFLISHQCLNHRILEHGVVHASYYEAWARYKSIAPAVLELEPCEQLVFLLDDKNFGVIREATVALYRIARWVDGAKELASKLVGNLAIHKSTAPAVLKLNLSVKLVSLLGGEDSLVHWVTYALSQITLWADGAKGVVDAKVLDHVLRLLKSPNPDTRESASKLVGNLASHESTAPAVLKLNPSVQLVSLLGGEDSLVPWATYALSQIAQWVDGVKGVVDAKVLDHILRLLESPNLDTQESASVLVGWVASHEATALAVLKLNPSVQLVSLLGGEDSLVLWVTYTLSQIVQWVDGAKGVVDAKVLDHILRLLESPNPDIQEWACVLVEGLASHEATASAILQLNPIPQLKSLLWGS